MKFLSAAALLVGFAAAETLTISHFLYVGVNGYPQISFNLSNGVSCEADHYSIPELGVPCSDPAYTVDIFEPQGHWLRVNHKVDDSTTLSGYFQIQMNGPIPTVLDQVGTSTGVLS